MQASAARLLPNTPAGCCERRWHLTRRRLPVPAPPAYPATLPACACRDAIALHTTDRCYLDGSEEPVLREFPNVLPASRISSNGSNSSSSSSSSMGVAPTAAATAAAAAAAAADQATPAPQPVA